MKRVSDRFTFHLTGDVKCVEILYNLSFAFILLFKSRGLSRGFRFLVDRLNDLLLSWPSSFSFGSLFN